jgi:hypothetical protein
LIAMRFKAHVADRKRPPMSAESKPTLLHLRPMNSTGFDWLGGALIRCIGWFDIDD